MLLTPLYIQALNINQWITDHVYRHHTLIYWKPETLRFVYETRKRHKWSWLLINYGIQGFLEVTYVAFMLQALYNPKQVSVVQVITAGFGVCMFISQIGTTIIYQLYMAEFVIGINQILDMDTMYTRRYAVTEETKLVYIARNKEATLERILSKIRLCNGKIDYLGVFVNLTVLGFIGILCIPWVAIYLELDGPYLIFGHILHDLSKPAQVFFHGIRVIILVVGVAEGCLCFSTLCLVALLASRGAQDPHILLASQKIGERVLMDLRHLCVTLSATRDISSHLVPGYLTLIYVVLVTLTCELVAKGQELAWHMYCVTVLIVIVTFGIAIVFLYFLVSIDMSSSALHMKWMRSCGSLATTRFRRRLLCKILKSCRPFKIPYGSLGKFTKATRTDFFSSLVEDIITAVLALRAK